MQKTVIVTGGSRGLGAAMCRKLASLGHPVAINYTTAAAAAEAVVGEIVAAGGRAVAVPGDVADEADVLRLFDTAEKPSGRSARWSTTPASSARTAGSPISTPRRCSGPSRST